MVQQRNSLHSKPVSPTVCPLHAHLLETQDECFQAGFKMNEIWGDKIHQKEEYQAVGPQGVETCPHEHSIVTVLGKILWHGLFLGKAVFIMLADDSPLNPDICHNTEENRAECLK